MFKRTTSGARKVYRYTVDGLLNLKQAKGHYQEFKTLAGRHMDPRAARRANARQESFAHAVQRMNLSADDIRSSYKHYNFRFYLFCFFLGVATALLLWGGIQARWGMVLSSLGAGMIFLGQMFNASFRCYQIRHHELRPVSAWWREKHEWFPTEYVPPRRDGRGLARKDH